MTNYDRVEEARQYWAGMPDSDQKRDFEAMDIALNQANARLAELEPFAQVVAAMGRYRGGYVALYLMYQPKQEWVAYVTSSSLQFQGGPRHRAPTAEGALLGVLEELPAEESAE